MPTLASSAETILQHADPEGASAGAKGAASFGSFKSPDRQSIYKFQNCSSPQVVDLIGACWNVLYAYHAYSVPRLVFPSIQENSSAIAILPHFLEVCENLHSEAWCHLGPRSE